MFGGGFNATKLKPRKFFISAIGSRDASSSILTRDLSLESFLKIRTQDGMWQNSNCVQ